MSQLPTLQERAAVFRDAAIERLTTPDELDELMVVTRPQSWLTLVAVGLLISAGVAWSFMGKVTITASGQGQLVAVDGSDGLEAVVFLPFARAHEVVPGMIVHLSPLGYPASRHGFLVGRVNSIGDEPLTSDSLQERWGTAGWVERLDVGFHLPVTVTLEPDPESPSGYRWTSQGEPARQLSARIPVDASFRLRSDQPIVHALPWLRQAAR